MLPLRCHTMRLRLTSNSSIHPSMQVPFELPPVSILGKCQAERNHSFGACPYKRMCVSPSSARSILSFLCYKLLWKQKSMHTGVNTKSMLDHGWTRRCLQHPSLPCPALDHASDANGDSIDHKYVFPKIQYFALGKWIMIPRTVSNFDSVTRNRVACNQFLKDIRDSICIFWTLVESERPLFPVWAYGRIYVGTQMIKWCHLGSGPYVLNCLFHGSQVFMTLCTIFKFSDMFVLTSMRGMFVCATATAPHQFIQMKCKGLYQVLLSPFRPRLPLK